MIFHAGHGPRTSGIIAVHAHVGWARRWYESLGWRSGRTDDVFVPFPLAGGAFALWSLADAADTVAAVVTATGGFDGVLLSSVVDDESDVDALLAAAAEAGGEVVVAADATPWGRVGWFADPAGTPWEVSWIRGKDAVAPFAGSAAPGARNPRVDAVTISAAEPERLMAFYTELGWVPADVPWAGRPALVAAGPVLAFAHSAERRAPFAGLAAEDPQLVAAGHDALIGAGATSLLGPASADPGALVAAVTDPHGLVWEIAEARNT